MKNRYLIFPAINFRADLYRSYSVFLLFILFIGLSKTVFSQENQLEQKISIESQKSTVYELLNKLTELTGYYFIYDSKIVNSDKSAKLTSKSNSLKQALDEILDDNSLDYKIIDKHILIFKKEHQDIVATKINRDSIKVLNVKGFIIDKYTRKPLPFVSLGIIDKNIGTISNFDGYFSFKISPQNLNSTITISHLGYKSQRIPVQALLEQNVEIQLETDFISIQEVIIRNIDPKEVVRIAFEKRKSNYSKIPLYITGFYREGVLRNSKYLNYSEAVVKFYKAPITSLFETDQVKLLQSRKVINTDQQDTLIIKLKAGLQSCLTLDIVKSLPDFFDPELFDNYIYTKYDIVSIDSRYAYAISFEQKDFVTDPLYKGTLFIDMESFAIVGADFEINPKYVENTREMFIVKRNRKANITPKQISYNVSYILRDGKYYVNHIRGDLTINYKKRYHLFSNDFRVFLELASCSFDSINVQRFHRDEVLKANTVFLDTQFKFDESFWGDYNTISPEEKISQALSRINAKMEVIKPY